MSRPWGRFFCMISSMAESSALRNLEMSRREFLRWLGILAGVIGVSEVLLWIDRMIPSPTIASDTPTLPDAGIPADLYIKDPKSVAKQEQSKPAVQEKIAPVSFEKLLKIETKLHPQMKPELIPEFISLAERIFPGVKIAPIEILAIIYTEGAFESMVPSYSGDTGPLQVIPEMMTAIFDKADKATETDRLLRLNFLKKFGVVDFAGLKKKFPNSVEVATMAGILYMQDIANSVDIQFNNSGLSGFSEDSKFFLRAAGHNRGVAPKALIDNTPKNLESAKITGFFGDLLKKWADNGGKSISVVVGLDTKGNPIRKDILLNSTSLVNLNWYTRRALFYKQIFDVISNLANEGKIESLANSFPKEMRAQIDKWIDADIKGHIESALNSNNKTTELLAVILPKTVKK